MEPPTDLTTDLDSLTAPVKGVYDYWQSLPRCRGLPLKSALAPMEIPREFLPHVFLMELEYDPFAALVRLQGTYINYSLGQHFTDKYVDESTFGENAADILASYEEAAIKRVAYVSQEEILSTPQQTMLIEAIHLPMVDQEGEVKFIFGALSRLSGSDNPDQEFRGRQWDVKMRSQVV
ncbi:PAS domain-containing protein [Kiloniella sp. EL199]|uniref:PAS domain-containing protein n=1 Tax=Kiloniella sp. EL199 TaxID=2107581 RepID=UPI0013C3E605|nr:PAS domain-containing protein [Kiloniella sp. EL199]